MRIARAFFLFALCFFFAYTAVAEEDHSEEHPLLVLMKAMPAHAIAEQQKARSLELTQLIVPGLRVEPQKRIYLDATVLFSQGPQDGLEAIACMRGGKNHESLLLLECANGELIKSMFIGHLNMLHDGIPAREESGIPARGYPVRVLLRWRPDAVLEPDLWVERDVSTMVRDRSSGAVFPALPYVYVGSRFHTVQKQQKFMLNVTKTLITNYDEPDTLLASPFPLAMFDYVFEANSADMPEEDLRVQLVFERPLLPLTLQMDVSGVLRYRENEQAEAKVLDDAALRGLLSRYFGSAYTGLRAVRIEVISDCGREFDVQARERIMKQSAAAQAWVVPVFIPVDREVKSAVSPK